MRQYPTAWWVGRKPALLLALLPLTVGTVWGIWHVVAVYAALTGHGNPLALTWAASFLLLWWVVVAWWERPATTTARQERALRRLRVAVQVPVYNEDPDALRDCLWSLLTQSRLPDRILVTDDGSANHGELEPIRIWFGELTRQRGIDGVWRRTKNRGKRWAQYASLYDDASDVIVTLDSDSVLDRRAVEEGMKPFVDPRVMSVAGMVVVWNSRRNFLTMLTCMLYTPFTRGFRSAQSVLGRVLVNSGTLAFYRGHVVRDFWPSYLNERFMDRPMQMNDDSMLTFAALLKGRTVHQPSSIAFTLVPAQFTHYWNQQLRWMRGTNVRTLWWWRYFSPLDFAWWMPIIEWLGFVLSFLVAGYLLTARVFDGHRLDLLVTTAGFGVVLNYTISLRYFIIRRSDESLWFQFATYLLAPVAGVWRIVFLRSMMLYGIFTFWKIGKWGTRTQVEVGAA